MSDDPYLEAVIPSLSDPTLAPEGRHVMSVLVQWAPHRLDGDWEKEREGLGDLVLKTLDAYAPGLPGWSRRGRCSRRSTSSGTSA